MEGDTKIWVDALNSDLSSIEWSISTLLCNVVGRGGAIARLSQPPPPLPPILKNYFILCISIQNFKYLATKIEIGPPPNV